MKDFPDGQKKMAKRMEKHLCQEENMIEFTWKLLIEYINVIISDLESTSKKCYDKPLNDVLLKSVRQALNSFDLNSFLKK
jgi:hypothetical protein